MATRFCVFNMFLKTIALLLIVCNHNYVQAWWKPFEGRAGPLEDGLSAGQNSFGNEVYVARGYFRDNYAPGKLLVDTTSAYKVGLYVENSGAEQYIASNIEYYAKEPTCNYKWVPSSNGQSVNNAVEYTTNQATFYVGRIFAGGSVEVGKISKSMPKMHYGKGHQTTSYEVLICERITVMKTTEQPPTTCKPLMNPVDEELAKINSELRAALTEKINENSELKKQLSKCEEQNVE